MADYIPLFLDWARSTEGLSDAEKGRLVDAMVAYANGEDWQNLVHGNERFVLNVFRGQIERHMEMLKANKANGNKGGRPKKTGGFEEKTGGFTSETGGYETETGGFETETWGFDEKPNKSKSKSNNNSNSNIKGVIGAQSAPSRARSARFTPPTVDDVCAFCSEHGYNVDAERFVAYYEANGWRVGRNPMKDWRAAVRTWVRNDYSTQRGGVTDGSNAKPAASDDADLWAGMSDEDIKLVEQLANDGEHYG